MNSRDVIHKKVKRGGEEKEEYEEKTHNSRIRYKY